MKKQKTKTASLMKGCLITILAFSALLIWTFSQITEPDRRAKRTRAAIGSGMFYGDIEELLTGRYFCIFQTRTNDQWHSQSFRTTFTDPEGMLLTGEPDTMRLQLHFMGMSPRRVSFYVELNGAGNVTNTTDPYGWD
jgi:hypothetical protein